ncbi:MAG: hypothetical protein LKJ50_04635 [Clostridiales bacterium]|jgi:hypothetical protein|nr:hypothetical protein [Clostridiales bacterium]MCI2021667.1 hypothetical protein [Clostridiales bacterium]MCI2026453.1 hypothetical protein [Clostridiales bacterium]
MIPTKGGTYICGVDAVVGAAAGAGAVDGFGMLSAVVGATAVDQFAIAANFS